MPTAVPIEIFFLSRTEVDRAEARRWLEFLGVPDYPVPEKGGPVSEAGVLVGLAGKRCYKAFGTELNPNISRVRDDWGEYLDNVLKSGHGSVTEHGVWSFAIENVSRVFTGEMNRHRAGWAISEGSMRFIRFGQDIPYWQPTCLQGPEDEEDPVASNYRHWDANHILLLLGQRAETATPVTLDQKKELTRIGVSRAFSNQQTWYRIFELIWADELRPESPFKQKKELTSMFRRIVGMGCATGGVWTGNIRAIRHVMTMRCEPAAEEEILHVFSRIVVEMKKREPMLLGDFEQDDQGFWRPKYRKV